MSSRAGSLLPVVGATAVGATVVGGALYYKRHALEYTAVEKKYDYIIVGGGTSGCVLASRLSEDPKVTVLLLEAGMSDEVERGVYTPASASNLQRGPIDWTFKAEKQEWTNERVSNWPRGKVLGGSSCLNWMLWVQGHPNDYNEMAEKFGAVGWSYPDLLPYFQKAEKMVQKQKEQQPANEGASNRGDSGPMHIEHHPNPNIYTDIWLKAAQEAGIPFNYDYNGGNMKGCTRAQVAIKDGRRVSSASAYLRDTDAISRPNLHVKCGVQVTRIILEQRNGDSPRAAGVVFQTTDSPQSAKIRVLAQKEVIISAGSVQSPHLLMLSGIGNRNHLTENGIDCQIDLPGVGENLQDHLFVPLANHATTSLTMDLRGIYRGVAIAQYLLTKSGPVSSQGLEAMAFLDSKSYLEEGRCITSSNGQNEGSPDLQLHFVCAGGQNEQVRDNLGYEEDYNKDVDRSFVTLPTLLHPKSVGSIKLNSSDPLQPPRIIPNYLSHPDDLAVLVRGIKIARQIHQSHAFESYRGSEVLDSKIKDSHPSSDEYLEKYIKSKVVTVYHPVGTCRIGDKDDPKAVVDNECKVIGCAGLRVVDCSVFPKLVGANTYAPAIVAGEKVADLIKQSPGYQSKISSRFFPLLVFTLKYFLNTHLFFLKLSSFTQYLLYYQIID